MLQPIRPWLRVCYRVHDEALQSCHFRDPRKNETHDRMTDSLRVGLGWFAGVGTAADGRKPRSSVGSQKGVTNVVQFQLAVDLTGGAEGLRRAVVHACLGKVAKRALSRRSAAEHQ
ncbi:hypothetical protein BKA66DRAFT_439767 [Pyrenochaeta sp. MPI-SDFR-AT-0127]|nr:hypothetical protein BKA66DRAFT_439767 [Pyrenochaeta sp. MPI-SDFR-AT-0127]